MPLLDHFHPPLSINRSWESFHATWSSSIADELNLNLLPEGYIAEEQKHFGPLVEIDVATFDQCSASDTEEDGGVITLKAKPQVWTPPAPAEVLAASFPDSIEIRVYEVSGSNRLVAAVELVSEANKDRPASRRAFAAKIAGYLAQGVSAIVIDAVSNRNGNSYEDVLGAMYPDRERDVAKKRLYAAAFRPIVRDLKSEIECWYYPLGIGEILPILPLALNAEICLPVNLESTYVNSCRRRRLINAKQNSEAG